MFPGRPSSSAGRKRCAVRPRDRSLPAPFGSIDCYFGSLAFRWAEETTNRPSTLARTSGSLAARQSTTVAAIVKSCSSSRSTVAPGVPARISLPPRTTQKRTRLSGLHTEPNAD